MWPTEELFDDIQISLLRTNDCCISARKNQSWLIPQSFFTVTFYKCLPRLCQRRQTCVSTRSVGVESCAIRNNIGNSQIWKDSFEVIYLDSFGKTLSIELKQELCKVRIQRLFCLRIHVFRYSISNGIEEEIELEEFQLRILYLKILSFDILKKK